MPLEGEKILRNVSNVYSAEIFGMDFIIKAIARIYSFISTMIVYIKYEVLKQLLQCNYISILYDKFH